MIFFCCYSAQNQTSFCIIKNIFVWSPGAILLNAEAGKNIYGE